jgi:hypothetical protein
MGGWYFDFPTDPNSVHYVLAAVNMVVSNYVDARILVTTTGTPAFVYKLQPDNTCVYPAHVRFLLQQKGDDLSGAVALLGEREAITMQMQQVRYFLALCEELNFTRAARRCGVSQPSLTTAISVLERELGGALFDRKPSIALTGLGRVVRPYLDEIARNADHAREVARTLTPRPVADRSARQAVDSSEHLSN